MPSRSPIPALLLSVLAFLLACRSSAKPALVEGGLYSWPQEDGSCRVLKILKLEPNGVHIRIYGNKFDAPPKEIDETALIMRGIGENEKPSDAGIGHLPIARENFATWPITYIKTVPVADAELEGYKVWLEAKGGYF